MIKFGVAGNSLSFYAEGHERTEEAAKWCRERGIEVFEYSFGRGVTMNEATAKKLGAAFSAEGVELSVHAPYFINFSNPDPEMISKSIGYVLASCKKAVDFGGERVVVHPATQGKMTRDEARAVMTENVKILHGALEEKGYVGLFDCYYPCIDFGHINAREQGILNKPENYNTLIKKMLDFLPKHKVFNMHVHFSKIQYGAKGEIRHLTFADNVYGPDYRPLMEIFHREGMTPVIISESDGTQAEDSMEMKRYYYSLNG